jgi:Zn ribbon nucleic-acid-binding protein
MSQIQSAPPVCPNCQKPMKLMLAKRQRQRILRCVDCGQPDPMQTADAQGWLKGELAPEN